MRGTGYAYKREQSDAAGEASVTCPIFAANFSQTGMAPEEQNAPAAQSPEPLEGIWEMIPPEERLEVLASAQARGLEACLMLLLMAFSAALGLRNPWVFFASLLVMPFAFQSVTNRAWRLVKALPMLEYATARTSARVYAQIAGSGHADPRLMFRAFLEPAIRDDYPDEALERTSQKPVWVSLFPDTLVIASESREGARLELAHNIFGNFSISADGGEEGDESQVRKLTIEVESHPGKVSRWHIASPHPTKLFACDRLARALIEKHERMRKVEEERRLAREREAKQKLAQPRAHAPQLHHSAAP